VSPCSWGRCHTSQQAPCSLAIDRDMVEKMAILVGHTTQGAPGNSRQEYYKYILDNIKESVLIH